jgi:hypothetical protein
VLFALGVLERHGSRARVGAELEIGYGRMRHVPVASSVLFEFSCSSSAKMNAPLSLELTNGPWETTTSIGRPWTVGNHLRAQRS